MTVLLAAIAVQTASAQTQFERVSMEGVDIIGSVTYGKINTYDAMTPGYYAFRYEQAYQANLTSPLLEKMVLGGCTYHDGKIYSCEYEDENYLGSKKPHWVIYDAKTFKILYDKEMGDNFEMTTYSMTYDVKTDMIYAIKKMYGLQYDGDKRQLIKIDPATGTPTTVGNYFDNKYKYTAIGSDKNGILYITYMENVADDEGSDKWYMSKVSKVTGKFTAPVEVTVENPITGEIQANTVLDQALFCNYQTGKMYWLFPSNSSNTSLCELNVLTGVATLKAYVTKDIDTSGAFFLEPSMKAPAIVSDFKFVEDATASLTGKLQMQIPAEAYDGTALDGKVTVTVKEGDKTILSAEAEPGKLFTSDDLTFTNEKHKVSITLSNAAGEGPTINRSFFVGYDIPTACKNVKLTNDGLKTILTWDAPTVGVNGSPVDASKLTYKVVRISSRNPDMMPLEVANGLKECRFEEEQPGEMYTYAYQVTPSVGQADGKTVTSNYLVVGTPLDVPFGGAFESPLDFMNYYTVIDANQDGYSWGYVIDKASARYTYNPLEDADDWLISPAINYKKGKTYELTFSAHSAMEDYLETMEVTFGNDKTPAAQSKQLLYLDQIPMPPSAVRDNVYTVTFEVPEDGVYYYGFHCISPKYHSYLFLHDIFVQEKASSSIAGNLVDAAKVDSYYTLGGQRVNGLQKGVNILKMKDGTTKKFVVK